MALVKGTNSYATVAEADAYFADRLDVSAWTSATPDMKAQALVTATQVLDGQNWVGTAVSDTQKLSFPRNGVYFDPRLGYDATLTSEVPSRVVTACYELAHHLLNNDGLLDDTGDLESLSVASVSITFKTNPGLIPGNVKRLIKPLLSNSGANHWWRAN